MKFNNRNVFISKKAIIGQNVRIGDNTTIYDHVVIEDNVTICNDCIIGEPGNDYYHNESYQNPPTFIRVNSLIRSHAIIYSGVDLGESFSCGHRVTIREKTVFGKNCRVGTLSYIQGHVNFGDYCWLHSNVHIGQNSKIGNFVFIYPYVVFTNDPTPPSNVCIGPTVGDYTQIAVGSILLPGTVIGKHCLIGAGSTVGKNISDYKLVLGSPGKEVKDVREILNKETGLSHYPWPNNFERGMPWEGEGYYKWLEQQ